MSKAPLALALLLAAAPVWARRSKMPAATDLLRRSLQPSAGSYEGRMRVEIFAGGISSVKLIAVRFQKGMYRREVLDAAGQVVQLAVSDGKKEWIYDKARNKAWVGEPADPDLKRLGPDDEFDLLTDNYEVTASSSEPVAERACWRLELRARTDGRLQRRLWVDRKTGLVLASEDYRPQGGLTSSARFEKLSFPRRQSKKLFRFQPPPGVAVAKRQDNDFLALEQAKSAGGVEPKTPAWLPPGYVFESLDVLPRGGSRIVHYRFSDGINVLSLFQCPAKVKLDFGATSAQTVRLDAGEGTLAWTQEGQALGWEKGRSRFLLVGPLSGETLRRIADSVR